MIDRGARGMVINPGSLLGVPGVPTSYTFAVLDVPSLGVPERGYRQKLVVEHDLGESSGSTVISRELGIQPQQMSRR